MKNQIPWSNTDRGFCPPNGRQNKPDKNINGNEMYAISVSAHGSTPCLKWNWWKRLVIWKTSWLNSSNTSRNCSRPDLSVLKGRMTNSQHSKCHDLWRKENQWKNNEITSWHKTYHCCCLPGNTNPDTRNHCATLAHPDFCNISNICLWLSIGRPINDEKSFWRSEFSEMQPCGRNVT
jgi:hypothetical protein